ncbi:dihydrolipoyl dehydrogenase family protein [Listeria ivanovii]|uniref:dihydrolipoyl dehydrogenase family protein n=1 Tax=Listeria ivanovii TaxID=1638 RepID=UPI0005128847|nr:NAD(P)/FAD-dependent oxidoreductase [Listeria ivanovii]AIS62667.1 pyridine nucleotide-disulfide oxidoreductase [Listeria ivanovii subsp. londoniensis]MBK1967250.1 NAD(P)/FAD-dependent oxidoreductase [Listeria ivanovii subsp. londoniensis]MBK1985188.1 NAD(P)/FAD-dependent oxidoreductase [Listeria ivanovii subsp. londoniensis]MBK1996638.1 NAD(P)/FAD-dependent oxidoreductase [Listeria ivanovii subsp. londoniensis]MBM5608944.1 NAD(P)/FAD-dependent oxidoreductase [Listeria ivanovii]
MTEYTYDVVVIGSGASGTTVAFETQAAGLSVAIIEERSWGGTCVLRGCDPKKVLIGASEARNFSKRLRGKGIKQAATISWTDLMAFKETFVEDVPEQRLQSFQDAGIETFFGKARFNSKDSLQVGENVLKTKNIVLATGASPNKQNIPGSEFIQNSDDFLSLPTLPDSVTFIGGGYISFEFASIVLAAGKEVHIIHHNSQPLKKFDPDFVAALVSLMEEEGVHFHFDTAISKIEKKAGKLQISGENAFSLDTDIIIGATGRSPNIAHLSLENAEIEYTKKGITVNEKLQTIANPHIYACGDVAASKGAPLTPVVSLEATVVAQNILEANKAMEYPAVPSVVFTSPKLASIGISLAEAKKQADRYEIKNHDTTSWYTYKRTNEPLALAKIIVDKNTQQIKGAHFLSEEADYMINYIALLMKANLTLTDLQSVIFAYPSPASDLTALN